MRELQQFQFVSSCSYLESLAFLPRRHRWFVGAPYKGSTLAQAVGQPLTNRPTTNKGESYCINQGHWSWREEEMNKREDKWREEIERRRERNKGGHHGEEREGEAQGWAPWLSS